MAGYDAYVRIGTKLESNGLTKELKAMGAELTATAKEAMELQKELNKLSSTPIYSKEYKELEKAIDSTTKALDRAVEAQIKFMETGGSKNSQTFRRYEYDIALANERLAELTAKKQALEASGAHIINPNDGARIAEINEQMARYEARISEINKKIEAEKAKITKVEKAVGALKNSASKVGGAFKKLGASIGASFKNADKSISKTGTHIKGLLKSALLFNVLSRVFSGATKGMAQGFNNVAQYSEELNGKLSVFKSSLVTLGNSFGAMVAPIASAVLPALTTMTNYVNQAVEAVNRLISALMGNNTWTKATAQQVAYADSVNDSAKSAKKAQGALQGFNELNNISSGGASDDSGSGASGGAVAFTTEQIDTKDFDLANKIKETLQAEDWSFIGVAVGEKMTAGLQAIPWDGIQAQLVLMITQLTTLLNGFLLGTDWSTVGVTLATVWNTVWLGFVTLVTTFDFTALGTAISNLVTGALNAIDFGLIGTAISGLIAGALDLLIAYLTETDWASVTLTLFNGFIDIVTNIDWIGLAGKVVQLLISALGALVEAVLGLITGLFDKIAWIFSNLGTVLPAIWNAIKTAVVAVIQTLVSVAGGIFEAFKNTLSTIFNAIKTVISTVFNAIKSVITTIVNGIVNGVTTAFTGMKNTISTIFNAIKTAISTVFNGIWTTIKKVINSILGGIQSFVNGIIGGINTMIKAMNKLSWDIPDWVPVLGGKKFGFSLKTIEKVSIPKLANGGIATGSTIANIGEAGKEAVLPLENNLDYLDPLVNKLADKLNNSVTFRVEGDPNGIFRVTQAEAKNYFNRTGREAFSY